MWGEGPIYLGDSHNSEHIAFAEGQVLLSRAMEIVLGNALCTGWPGGLQGGTGQVGCTGLEPSVPLLTHACLMLIVS